MITPNTKKIFSNAAKKTEAFAREAISVFPKKENIKLAYVEPGSAAEKLMLKDVTGQEFSGITAKEILDKIKKKKGGKKAIMEDVKKAIKAFNE
jgi:hypothetical protein